ncbi:hypothetical protein AAFF_G00171180 [Aldrovandia affinis]|uniref:Uncharacterized protein n=1 Tax=Aldrovandia affinis TaxID=143900 RepID=A0AAD7W7N7_9TELE|nr:hypothetical protein AAFF_G00171180 [Aldrovandia affinis]
MMSCRAGADAYGSDVSYEVVCLPLYARVCVGRERRAAGNLKCSFLKDGVNKGRAGRATREFSFSLWRASRASPALLLLLTSSFRRCGQAADLQQLHVRRLVLRVQRVSGAIVWAGCGPVGGVSEQAA